MWWKKRTQKKCLAEADGVLMLPCEKGGHSLTLKTEREETMEVVSEANIWDPEF